MRRVEAIVGTSWKALCVVLLTIVVGGCAANRSGIHNGDKAPNITGISVNAAAVGDALEIYCDDCVEREKGWVDVNWKGTYTRSVDGRAVEVDYTVALQRNAGSNTLALERFGGSMRIPFDDGCGIDTANATCSLGTFSGTVSATNQYFDGTSIKQGGGGLRVDSFTVKPSIVIRAFLPFDDEGRWFAPCRYPARVALPGLSYLMDVEAVGFEPETFEYIIDEGLVQDGQVSTQKYSPPKYQRVSGTEPRHRVVMQFAPPPKFAMSSKGVPDSYRMNVVVRASGGGAVASLTHSFLVSTMFSTLPRTPWRIGEFAVPEQVGGCIANQLGQNVTYGYAKTKTESRSVGVSKGTAWAESVQRSNADAFGKAEAVSSNLSGQYTRQTADARSKSGSASKGAAGSLAVSQGRSAKASGSLGRSGQLADAAGLSNERVFQRDDKGEGGLSGKPLEVGISGGFSSGAMIRGESDNTGSSTTSNGSDDSGGIDNGIDVNVADSVTLQRATGRTEGRTNTDSEASSFSGSQSLSRADNYLTTKLSAEGFQRGLSDSVQTNLTVSESETTSETISGQVPSGQYGVWYRQLVRLVRQYDVVAYDYCGNGTVVGKSTIDDFRWTYSLAIGNACPPIPLSCLPKPQCLLPNAEDCKWAVVNNYEVPAECSKFSYIYDIVFKDDKLQLQAKPGAKK